jgi:hypothetical protein
MSDNEAAGKFLDAPTAEGADWLLQNLILLASDDMELPVTLTVSGATISGHMVSGKRFLSLVKELLSGGGQHTGDFGKWLEGEYADLLAEDGSDGDGPYFVHLRDAAYIMGPAQIPGGRQMIWRGKLSDVSGFSLGALEVAKP